MSWVADFLLGLCTRHLGTKLLALLLSVGLFSFVLLSQTGTREITLELQFRLADELTGKKVLLDPRVLLKGLKITGLRAKVDPMAKRYLADSLQTLEIDQSFLGRHSVGGEGYAIPIDRKFFTDEALFGKEIEVAGIPDGVVVELDDIVTRNNVPVELDPDLDLVLPKDHNYEGTGPEKALEPQIAPKLVTLIGPRRAFGGEETRLYVTVTDLAEQLDGFWTTKDRDVATLRNVSVDWGKSEISYRDYVIVRAGGRDYDATSFALALQVTCPVETRKETIAVSLEIAVLSSRKEPKHDLRLWKSMAELGINDPVLEAGVVEDFAIRLPKRLKTNQALRDNLLLVLNVANARVDESGNLIVPVYLGLKDPTRAQDREDLRLIEIAARAPEVRFRTK